METIELGQKVRCQVTGFEGIVIAKCEYLNGCIQFEVQPKSKKDNAFGNIRDYIFGKKDARRISCRG